jgi:predicted DNA-binding protein (MmcQ/YjbR family)
MKDAQHDRLLAIVKSLPGATEDWPWGSIHCKVDGKIFAGWGRDESGDMILGIRVDKDLQGMLVASDSRFTIAKYVGKYGGIDMNIGKKPNWAEVEHFIVGSYRIIASKRRVKELDAETAAKGAPNGPRKAARRQQGPGRGRGAAARR